MASQNGRVIAAVTIERADEYGDWLDGWDVERVSSHESLLETVDAETAVVLLDGSAGGSSPEQVLDRLREQGIDRPVVLLSDAEPDADGLAVRFTETLVTPVDESTLAETVGRVAALSDEGVQKREYVSLAATQAALELQLSPSERQSSEEYDRLTERIDALRDRADGSLDEVGDQIA
jgi:FixJ family two-component response regulator